jgi:hypothetical protein
MPRELLQSDDFVLATGREQNEKKLAVEDNTKLVYVHPKFQLSSAPMSRVILDHLLNNATYSAGACSWRRRCLGFQPRRTTTTDTSASALVC